MPSTPRTWMVTSPSAETITSTSSTPIPCSPDSGEAAQEQTNLAASLVGLLDELEARRSKTVRAPTTELLMRGEGATVQRWLAALSAELVGSRPRLLLVRTRLRLLSGRVEGVDGLLAAAEHALAVAPGVVDEPYQPLGEQIVADASGVQGQAAAAHLGAVVGGRLDDPVEVVVAVGRASVTRLRRRPAGPQAATLACRRPAGGL